MTTCIYDAHGMQLCCFLGLSAATAYLELFQLDQTEVILETIPVEVTKAPAPDERG